MIREFRRMEADGPRRAVRAWRDAEEASNRRLAAVLSDASVPSDLRAAAARAAVGERSRVASFALPLSVTPLAESAYAAGAAALASALGAQLPRLPGFESGRLPDLLWKPSRLLASYRGRVPGDLAVSLARQGPLTPREAFAHVRSSQRGDEWRVERIARTVLSMAWNSGVLRAASALAPRFPGLRLRWTEHVDDLTLEPTDSRTAFDSVLMHGQAQPPGWLFRMPDDARAPVSLHGKAWPHPPNRPNDRAVLEPWLPGSRKPAWGWDGRRRTPLA